MYTLTRHAAEQATLKGWSLSEIVDAANNPQTTYANGRYENQMRHIRGDIVAVVNTVSHQIVTVYKNVVETDLRADQKDADAIRYNNNRNTRRK